MQILLSTPQTLIPNLLIQERNAVARSHFGPLKSEKMVFEFTIPLPLLPYP